MLRFNSLFLTKSSRLLSSSPEKYDALVVGGGIVGFAFAAFAVFKNKRILLLESSKKKAYSDDKIFKNRVVALSPRSKQYLQKLNAWHSVENRSRPIKEMQVWENGTDSMICLKNESNIDDIAYITENDLILHSLQSTLSSLNKGAIVDVLYGASVESIQFPNSNDCFSPVNLKVKTDDGISNFSCELVVGADGYKSLIRKSAKIPHISWHSELRAIVATLKMNEIAYTYFSAFKQTHDGDTAWQKFLPKGPIAFLPLSNEYVSLVWSTDESEVKNILKMTKDEIIERLNILMTSSPNASPLLGEFFESLMSGALKKIGITQIEESTPPPYLNVPQVTDIVEGSIASFPIAFSMAQQFVAPRLALIGDAAHRVLPLAGQGLNLGIGDAFELSNKIGEAILEGADINNLRFLSEFETCRQRAVVPFAALIEVLYWLYCGESKITPQLINLSNPVVDLLKRTTRSVGLNIVNKTPVVKEFLMKSAMNGEITIPISVKM